MMKPDSNFGPVINYQCPFIISLATGKLNNKVKKMKLEI